MKWCLRKTLAEVSSGHILRLCLDLPGRTNTTSEENYNTENSCIRLKKKKKIKKKNPAYM